MGAIRTTDHQGAGFPVPRQQGIRHRPSRQCSTEWVHVQSLTEIRMKHPLFIAALLLAGSIAARADDVDPKKALTIANNSDCLTCHAVTKKVIGPAYRDVASKYKGDDEAPNRLLQKVKNGGSGVWGKFAM